MPGVGRSELGRRWCLPWHRVEKLSPLLTVQVELEVPEWANAPRRQLNLSRHAFVDVRIDHDFPTIYLANCHPVCGTQSAAGWRSVSAYPDITHTHPGTALRRREGVQYAACFGMLVEPTMNCFVDSDRERSVYVWGNQGAEYRTPA